MKILFFSPYSGIRVHAYPEAIVAMSLKRKDLEIVYMSCRGVYSLGCYAMAAHGASHDTEIVQRQKICARCIHYSNFLNKALGIERSFIEDYLDSHDYAQIESLVAHESAKNALNLFFDGLPVGRYALHETLLNYKLNDLGQIDQDSESDYIVKLRGVATTLLAANKFIQTHKPDRIVMYNTNISTNFALMNLAENNGIPVYGLHAGGNMGKFLQSLYVYRKDDWQALRSLIYEFERGLSEQSCDEVSILDAIKHVDALVAAKEVFVYSAPKSKNTPDIRSIYNIDGDKKILLATLSSYDEIVANQMIGVIPTVKLLFQTQIEWIRFLIQTVKLRPDLFLIIRIHPREFPNRRDSRTSAHAIQLRDALNNLPDNVRINWPADNISLYDVGLQSDVVLNAWSSAGKELALFGIPVVLYQKDILLYPSTINFIVETEDEYVRIIDVAIEKGVSSEVVVGAFRWLAHQYTFKTINIEDAVNFDAQSRNIITRLLNKFSKVIGSSFHYREDLRNLRKPFKESEKFYQAIVEQKDIHDIQFRERCVIDPDSERRLIGETLKNIKGINYKLLLELGISETELINKQTN
ncbi:MAG: hypothetical protein WC647_18525 [Desulfomonilaceae bacterium]|jgi:hypothetical protein